MGTYLDEDEDHDHDEDEDFALITAKIGVLVGSIYAMWFIGAMMRLYGIGHGHSHGLELDAKEEKIEAKKVEVKADIPIGSEDGKIGVGNQEGEVKWSTIWGILIGDCFHNFVDGIAVGVSWTSGYGAGLGTTIAIMMHEIPHELGDFVLYKKLGLSTRQAIGFNVMAAMVSFGGLYTGLALAEDPSVVDWLLALVAGLFIYISLVDVMPEMHLKAADPKKFTRFLTQNIGLLLGFAMMIILALFEEDIEHAI